MDSSHHPMSAAFDGVFATQGQSATISDIFRSAFGEESPPPEAATFSFVTRSDLLAGAAALAVGPEDRFADLGCGSGGPTLWMATRTGATATGIDLSRVGVERARERAPSPRGWPGASASRWAPSRPPASLTARSTPS
jgi:SAM-dependent methyltransferase